MPRFVFLIKADAAAESGGDLPAQAIEAMWAYNESLNAAGILLGGEALRPSKVESYRLNFSAGSEPAVASGPFDIDAENHVCGYWIVQTKDAEEALSYAKKIPFPSGEVIIRKVADAGDLGSAMTEEFKAREHKLKAEAADRFKASV